MSASLKLLGLALAIGGLLSGGVVRGVWFDWFERPAIIRQTQEADAAIYEEAAAEARRKAGEELFKAIDRLAIVMQQAAQQAEADYQARVEAMQQEIATYEEQLRAEGRSCPLTELDVQFLGSMRALARAAD